LARHNRKKIPETGNSSLWNNILKENIGEANSQVVANLNCLNISFFSQEKFTNVIKFKCIFSSSIN